MANNKTIDEHYFPLVNRMICHYCKNVVMAEEGREDFSIGCGIRKIDEKYLEIANGPCFHCSECTINCLKGCDKFESSGIPTHPVLINGITKENPLAKNIPISEQATEQGIEFELKVWYNLTTPQKVRIQDISRKL